MIAEDLKCGDFIYHKDGELGQIITIHHSNVTVNTTYNKLEDWDYDDLVPCYKKDFEEQVTSVSNNASKSEPVELMHEPLNERFYVYNGSTYFYKCGQRVLCLDRYTPIYLKEGVITALSHKFVLVYIDGKGYNIDPRDLTVIIDKKEEDENVGTDNCSEECKDDGRIEGEDIGYLASNPEIIYFNKNDYTANTTCTQDIKACYSEPTCAAGNDACFYDKCKCLLNKVYGFAKELETILDTYDNNKSFAEFVKTNCHND